MKRDEELREQHKKIFAKKLNYYMHLNHKQQDDIVNDLGINKSTISTWCRGVKMPRVNAIQALADYFGVTIADFLDNNLTSADKIQVSQSNTDFPLTEHEKNLIFAYRNKPEMQNSVDKLLDVQNNSIDVDDLSKTVNLISSVAPVEISKK